MPKPHKGECRLCGDDEGEVSFLDLPVNGSEGIWLCLSCRIVLTNMARSIQAAAGRARRAVWLKHKREKEKS